MGAAQYHIDEAVRILTALNLDDLRRRIKAAEPGIKAQSFDGPQVSSGQGPSDPTGSTATRDRHPPDHARQVEDHARKFHALAVAIAKIDRNHTPPALGSRDRLAAANEPQCWYCVSNHHEQAMMCGPLVTETPTDVGGRAPTPRLTGRGHYDGIRRTVDTLGRMPNEYELDHYARTGRWPPLKAEVTV